MRDLSASFPPLTRQAIRLKTVCGTSHSLFYWYFSLGNGIFSAIGIFHWIMVELEINGREVRTTTFPSV